jgi:hypothetical protein
MTTRPKNTLFFFSLDSYNFQVTEIKYLDALITSSNNINIEINNRMTMENKLRLFFAIYTTTLV